MRDPVATIGFFALAIAVVSLVWIWLEGVYYMIRDYIISNTFVDEPTGLVVTEPWRGWRIAFAPDSHRGRSLLTLLEDKP